MKNSLHKVILDSIAARYSGKLSKRKLREVLIHFKWNKENAIKAIESGQCDYWWSN